MAKTTTEERLLKLISQIETNDKDLAKELKSKRSSSDFNEEARNISPLIKSRSADTEGMEVMTMDAGLEAVILRVGRPVLTILNSEAQLEFHDAESEIWRERLFNARDRLIAAIPSVGRIEIQNHPSYDWLGTGWLVDKNIIVTNRHVAEIFGRSGGSGFIFRQSPTGQLLGSSIDLLQEAGRNDVMIFHVRRILHIEPEPGPDIAFLRVDQAQGEIPPSLVLDNSIITGPRDVAVVGYPAKDSRMPDLQLMETIFGNVYDKKRLAPGQITKVFSDKLLHDCSTLGGCSGGAVIDLGTGQVVGLHFAGRFLDSNYAVPAAVVTRHLQKLKNTTISSSTSTNRPSTETTPGQVSQGTHVASMIQDNAQNNQYSLTVPLQITVSLGKPVASNQPAPISISNGTPTAVISADEFDEDDLITEGRPEDYNDRKGYDQAFLGDGFEISLPEIASTRRQDDLLKYDNNGQEDHVLRYEHFSVAMSKARRICFYSAVNINGRTAKGGIPRAPWRLDPRIDKESQIIKECYGNPPKFSRGHMTRREDPVWGSEEARIRGNADSMCVTNATPQMQSFNAPVWLALEDHALDNARDDKMRISVFTGPVMKSSDPVKFGVKVPVEFWKVIAFIHDETGELCATGYKMTQKDHLPNEEFVFGAFDTAQLPIKKIERLTGLSFGNLFDHDPLNGSEESFEGPDMPVRPLGSIQEVRFI